MWFLVLIQNTRFVRINGTNQTKEGYRGPKPASKKLLVRQTIVFTTCIQHSWTPALDVGIYIHNDIYVNVNICKCKHMCLYIKC